MKKIPASVERTLKRLGEPVTIQHPSDSFYANASGPVDTYAIIDSQNVSAGEGKWDRKLVATLPALGIELNGAQLTRKNTGEKFTVSVYEKTYAGGNVAMQEVVLK
ncbi:hypothetical protein [Sphingobium sp. LSP13-1-1.1]|uniref:hypothetical protein n=1 Tax=Sphingobium sp. LSP13-1-1.1 TaxID=3135234 RepID=UPI00341E4A67